MTGEGRHDLDDGHPHGGSEGDDDFEDGGFKTGQGGFYADYELSSYSSSKHLNQ